MTAVIELTPLHIPARADDVDAEDFRTMIDIRNRVHEVIFGEKATIVSPAQSLPSWQEQTDEETHGWLVRADGDPIGRAILFVPLEEGSEVAEILVEVVPEEWGRGAGRVAIAELEQVARSRGRAVLRSFTTHRELGGERFAASTGWGSVPDDHKSRTARSAGYALGQVYRASCLDVSDGLGPIEELLESARAAASGYRYVSWTVPTPPERRDAYARMKARMSTDAPTGDIAYDVEEWDAARIERMDTRMVAQGFTGLIGAIEHIESGELVAYNELYHLGERSRPTTQNDTLVLKEHRGHRLGMLVKCENLLRWRQMMPESVKIMTDNAEENRPMLDINEAMGFVPIAYNGAWQKRIELQPGG